MVREIPLLLIALGWAVAAGSACSTKKIVIAEQCPSPATGEAEVKGESDVNIFGTTCAPCDDDDRPEFDDDGCPIYVTFDSCGGDICIGRLRISEQPADGGMSDAGMSDAGMSDAGDDDDAGAPGDGGG